VAHTGTTIDANIGIVDKVATEVVVLHLHSNQIAKPFVELSMVKKVTLM